MTLSMYDASVPVFRQMLGSLDGLLEKAEAHVVARKLEPSALLQARLSPDMFPLLRQVQIACDFARNVPARLAGVTAPSHDDAADPSLADLRALVADSLGFVEGLDRAAFADAGDREIVLRPGTPKERRIGGQGYLLGYGLPQFFFHVTTAYALLRHNGVEIGKRDYMGTW